MKCLLSAIPLLLLFACSHIDPSQISSINIIDRNGMSETISNKDRLNAFEQTDFLAQQPYTKVLRVYGREKNGDVRSLITSYHPNGEIKQYLEAINNRACGHYREWFPNGQIKVEARVIGGISDINTQAESSFLFEGSSHAWDQNGNLLATISYEKGELNGEATYYHEEGRLWKKVPYRHGEIDGIQEVYLDDGNLLQCSHFKLGKKEGPSVRYWNETRIAYKETYESDLLMEGRYFDQDGNLISEINEGSGMRAIFGKESLVQLQEFQKGVQQGSVSIFDAAGEVVRTYSINCGEKHGEEITYYPGLRLPKLLLTWDRGVMQGVVKNWYDNGLLESQREMSQNQKNGLLTSWYRDGTLMMAEEYENDNLIEGAYYRKGQSTPISRVAKGEGMATLFSSEGVLRTKISYSEGKPIEK